MSLVIWVIVVIAVIFLASAIRVVREYEEVIFRLGRLVGARTRPFLCRTIYRSAN